MLATTLQKQTETYQMIDQPSNPKSLVLLVENHDDSRSMLRMLLEIWGYRVIEAEDGNDSINQAISKCPNLVLMDVSLSKVDGLTTVRRMCGIEALRGVPIVFISGHAQPEFRTYALAAGGDDFLVKPIDFNQLEFILKKFAATSAANSGGHAI